MTTHVQRCRWVAVARGALAAAAASLTVFALTLVMRKVDAAIPQARDVVLGALGLALILSAGALDARAPEDSDAEPAPAEPAPWHQYDGSFRGMVG